MQYGNFQKSEFQNYWQKMTLSLIFECTCLNTIERSFPESCIELELRLKFQVNNNSGDPACTEYCK